MYICKTILTYLIIYSIITRIVLTNDDMKKYTLKCGFGNEKENELRYKNSIEVCVSNQTEFKRYFTSEESKTQRRNLFLKRIKRIMILTRKKRNKQVHSENGNKVHTFKFASWNDKISALQKGKTVKEALVVCIG